MSVHTPTRALAGGGVILTVGIYAHQSKNWQTFRECCHLNHRVRGVNSTPHAGHLSVFPGHTRKQNNIWLM